MVDLDTFFNGVLRGLGMQVTPARLSALKAWQQAEGGWTNNDAAYNPLNTTRGKNYKAMNPVGVRVYPNMPTGVRYTVATLRLPYYKSIIQALRNEAPLEQFAQAVYSSPWGTKQGIAGVSPGSTTTTTTTTPTAQRTVTVPGQPGQMLPQKGVGVGVSLKQLNQLAKQFGFKSFGHAFGMDDGDLAKILAPALPTVKVLPGGIPVVNPTGKTPKQLDRVLAHVEDYLGTPYKWGGKTPQTGFDCSGLVQYLYGKAGIEIGGYTIAQWRQGKKIPKGSLAPGDVVFFNWGTHPETGEEGPQHEGLYLGNGLFLQSPKSGDVVKISRLSDRTDFVGARRYV